MHSSNSPACGWWTGFFLVLFRPNYESFLFNTSMCSLAKGPMEILTLKSILKAGNKQTKPRITPRPRLPSVLMISDSKESKSNTPPNKATKATKACSSLYSQLPHQTTAEAGQHPGIYCVCPALRLEYGMSEKQQKEVQTIPFCP